MVGMHGGLPAPLAEAPSQESRMRLHVTEGTVPGKSLRTEFGSADPLPTFGQINCLFAEGMSSCPNCGIFQELKKKL